MKLSLILSVLCAIPALAVPRRPGQQAVGSPSALPHDDADGQDSACSGAKCDDRPKFGHKEAQPELGSDSSPCSYNKCMPGEVYSRPDPDKYGTCCGPPIEPDIPGRYSPCKGGKSDDDPEFSHFRPNLDERLPQLNRPEDDGWRFKRVGRDSEPENQGHCNPCQDGKCTANSEPCEAKSHQFLDQQKLTGQMVCDKLNGLADHIDHIEALVKEFECGSKGRGWGPVREALYKLEFNMDCFDVAIDKSDLNESFSRKEECKIASCFNTYAEALIRLLNAIKKNSKHLEGKTKKPILTAINSLRSADFTFVYELARRMQWDKQIKTMMQKEGALDGSTRHSIREAFAKFHFTPDIVGDDFKESKGPKGSKGSH